MMSRWLFIVHVDHSVLLLILNVSHSERRARNEPCSSVLFFLEELKSYRDFDLHYTNELPLSSFIPIPEDKEVGIIDVSRLTKSRLYSIVISVLKTLPSTRNIPKKSQPSLFEVGSFPGAATVMKSFDRHVCIHSYVVFFFIVLSLHFSGIRQSQSVISWLIRHSRNSLTYLSISPSSSTLWTSPTTTAAAAVFIYQWTISSLRCCTSC